MSRFAQLAERRADANGGDTWIVLDGPVEGHWTEDFTVQLDRSAARADHGASPVRFLVECDDLAASSPSTVARLAVVYVAPFSQPSESCPAPAAARALAWCETRLRRPLENAGRARVYAALEAWLQDDDCPLDAALALARKLDEHRYCGFAYPVDERFDEPAPETPTRSPFRSGAGDDDARRLDAFGKLLAALLLPACGADLDASDEDLAESAPDAARCACAWALGWGVFGTTLCLAESEPAAARHLAGDVTRWLRARFGDDRCGNQPLVRVGPTRP